MSVVVDFFSWLDCIFQRTNIIYSKILIIYFTVSYKHRNLNNKALITCLIVYIYVVTGDKLFSASLVGD